jgi:hypothetical protein
MSDKVNQIRGVIDPLQLNLRTKLAIQSLRCRRFASLCIVIFGTSTIWPYIITILCVAISKRRIITTFRIKPLFICTSVATIMVMMMLPVLYFEVDYTCGKIYGSHVYGSGVLIGSWTTNASLVLITSYRSLLIIWMVLDGITSDQDAIICSHIVDS